jgi:hypothetical protein
VAKQAVIGWICCMLSDVQHYLLGRYCGITSLEICHMTTARLTASKHGT